MKKKHRHKIQHFLKHFETKNLSRVQSITIGLCTVLLLIIGLILLSWANPTLNSTSSVASCCIGLLLGAVSTSLFRHQSESPKLPSHASQHHPQDAAHGNQIAASRWSRAVLQSSTELMIVTDEKGFIVESNSTAQKALGYHSSELIGGSISELIYIKMELHKRTQNLRLEDGQTVETGFESLVYKVRNQINYVDENEWNYVKKDGGHLPVSVRISAVRDQNQRIVKFLHVAQDVTELRNLDKVATESRQLSDAQLAALNAVAIVAITDPDGRIEYVNDVFCKISEYSRNELIGKDHRILKSDVHPDQFFAEMWQTISAGKVWRGEVCNRTKSGKNYWVDTSISPVFDRENRIIQYVAIRFLITQKKNLEKDLIDAGEKAMDAARTKGEFLTNMSHEIRTPLNIIIGTADILAASGLNKEQDKYVSTLLNAGETLLQLINDILDTSRIESGHLKLESIEFDLETALIKTIELMAMKAEDKKLNLYFDFDSTVPVFCKSDPSRLRQIVLNLLSNAIKFTDSGEVILSVEMNRNPKRRGTILFSVKDTGMGISAEQERHLFERFSQADSSVTRKFGGSGLGLSICKALVTLLGGEIWLEHSQIGSKFCFTISAQASSEVKTQHRKQQFQNLSHKTALLVTDSDSSYHVISRIVESVGVKLIRKKVNEALLERQESTSIGRFFDFILVENTKHLTSHLLLEKILTKYKLSGKPSATLLISRSDRRDTAHWSRFGVNSLLVKPVTRGALLSLLSGGDQNKSKKTAVLPAPQFGQVFQLLLVEDNDDNIDIIKVYLKGLNIKITVAKNGEEAIEQFKKSSFDLVFMDMQMPVKDGYAATREIREWEATHHKHRTAIVALTAHAMAEEVEKTRLAGCDEHIAKPIKKQRLLDFIQTFQKARSELRNNAA